MPDVRQRILENAHQRFLAEGPSAVSISRLCREMHIAKKTFYRHFDSKDALVAALVQDRVALYGQALLGAPGPAEPPDVRLAAILTDVLAVSAQSFSAVYLRDIEADHPRIWPLLAEGRRMMLAVVHAELVRGQELGVFRVDATPDEILKLLVLVLDRVLDPAVLVQTGLEPHRVSRLLFDLLFDGGLGTRSP